ncbi:MAG TPA: redoxin domain-containing protein [Dehalococcoidia bacterium]
MELQVLQQAYPAIQALGAQVIFIGPETRDNALKLMDKQQATIPLLYDLDGSVMEAYKIAFTIPEYLQGGYKMFAGFPDANPDTGWRLPVPATFVVDQKGVIRGRYVNADYTYRMEPAEILAVLQEIAGHD